MMEPPDPLGETLMRSSGSHAGKSAAWDAFNASKDEDELRTALEKIDIPKETKARLWDLKYQMSGNATEQGGAGKALLDRFAVPMSVAPSALGGLRAALSEHPIREGVVDPAVTMASGEVLSRVPGLARAAMQTPLGQGLQAGAMTAILKFPGIGPMARAMRAGSGAFNAARNEAMAGHSVVGRSVAEGDAMVNAMRAAEPAPQGAQIDAMVKAMRAARPATAATIGAAPAAAKVAAPVAEAEASTWKGRVEKANVKDPRSKEIIALEWKLENKDRIALVKDEYEKIRVEGYNGEKVSDPIALELAEKEAKVDSSATKRDRQHDRTTSSVVNRSVNSQGFESEVDRALGLTNEKKRKLEERHPHLKEV